MRRRFTDGDGRLVVQAWVGSRLLVVAAFVVVAIGSGRSFDRIVNNWDVDHFVRIAQQGYVVDNDVAFFPGLPLLLRAGELIGVPILVFGVFIAAVASVLAAAALYRLGGPYAAAAWLLAPTAVFTVVPYTEAPFCAAAFWAWERAGQRRWGQAAALAALACSFRVSGLFLIGALAVLALTQARRKGVDRAVALAWLLVPASVVFGYAYYLFLRSGSWTAWYTAQSSGWARGLTWPWESFLNTIPAILPGAYADHFGWMWMFRFEMVSMAVGVVTTLVCLFRRHWGEAAWVGVQVFAFSLSYWFMSVNRAVLLWFPLWIAIGRFCEWRPRGSAARVVHNVILVGALVLACAAVFGWAWMFGMGHWSS